MCKKVWAIAKLNFRSLKTAYIITAIVIIGMSSNYGMNVFIANSYDMADNYNISMGWTLWLLPVLASILVPARNLKRTMNLGGKRDNFFWGSLEVYAILAGIVSVAVAITDHVEMNIIKNLDWGGIFTSANVFGWGEYGILAVVFQQFAFLFLFTSFVHTLTAVQDKWFGWAADVLIIAIISVFSPIAPLRAALAWFFRAILFNSPLTQIPVCMILALAIYSLNKAIFARKAI